jgi:hypothetical protein
MTFYLTVPSDVTLTGAEGDAAELLGRAGIVAVRLADLASPADRGLGGDGRTALVAPGAGEIKSGDVVVFCKPVAVAKALVRSDGRVQAGGHPADHARLGVLEQQLDAMAGTTGTIDDLARSVELGGKVKGTARRAMTAAPAIRFTVLMTLMPEADYTEIMTAVLGDLPLVPWHRPYTVPTATVACTWRTAVGPAPLEKLKGLVLAAVDAEHQARDDQTKVGDLDAFSIDGSLTRVPDSPANRAAFGSTGTADGSAPYPQQRDLWLNAAATRATVGVVSGPAGAGGERDKGEAEQVLLDRALTGLSFLFTGNRIWIMDRNFPGVPRIKRMLKTGTHVLIRLKSDVALRRIGPRLPDDSHLAEISGGGGTLTVRVVEYDVTVAGSTTGETFRLVTDLLDDTAYPAHVLAEAYHWRWIGSETALKENKSTLHGAGPSTGAMLRSQSPGLIAQEHAAWVVAAELTRATARAAAAIAAPARTGPRAGQPVHPREISFTAARRAHRRPPRTHPDRPGPPPRPDRPPPLPRPQDQGPPRLPDHRPAPAHPRRHRPGPHPRHPPPRRLNTPTPDTPPGPAHPHHPTRPPAHGQPGHSHAHPPPSLSVTTLGDLANPHRHRSKTAIMFFYTALGLTFSGSSRK